MLAAIAWGIACGRAAGAAGDEPGAPYTYVLDTGAKAAEPLSPAAVRARAGWTALAEDDLTHAFTGDAAMVNDRLVVVLRGRAAGAELYALTAAGPVRQAAIVPIPSAAAPDSPASVRIIENNPGAVMVEAGFTSGSSSVARLTLRLTTGQALVEVRPGDGVDRIRVEAPSRYVAVPDFFGDDMILSPEGFAGPRVGLPAENFLLHFTDRGNCLVMCVWPSSQQQAAALLAGEGPQRAIAGSEIQCLAGKGLWVAALAGEGIWHERPVPRADAARQLVLNWKPPFAAKWRASLAGAAPIGPSWYFRGADDADQAAALAAERSPCCLDAQRALVELQPALLASTDRQTAPSLVVYPMDRSRATPLETFCPIDILRATLGVGPCQYILQTEGLATDANPTPDNVMTWIEKLFSKNREKKAADEIRDMLDQMVAHVEHAQKRIGQYAAMGAEVRALCQAEAGTSPAARAAQSLQPTLDYLEQSLAPVSAPAQPAEQARKLSEAILGLIGKQDASAGCRRLGIEARRLGALQDRTLANARMAARWLRQQALMMAAQTPESSPLAAKIQARIEQALQASSAK